MQENLFFVSPVYCEDKPEFLEKVDKACDKHIEASKTTNSYISEMNKRMEILGEDFKKVKDFAWSSHSWSIANDEDCIELRDYIVKKSYSILVRQGFDMKPFDLAISEFWVQEFPKLGGGHHDTHIHYNNHISGFYFLKCSEKTSKPVFHDPRPAALMSKLPYQDEKTATIGSDKITLNVKPGSLVIFNGYLPHQFTVDYGLEPFRFIHFNLQALPKNLIIKEKDYE
tara:strand:- start:51 stop:731 length:681 start_codon:yes stop_codon:yes gene_type:complete